MLKWVIYFDMNKKYHLVYIVFDLWYIVDSCKKKYINTIIIKLLSYFVVYSYFPKIKNMNYSIKI